MGKTHHCGECGQVGVWVDVANGHFVCPRCAKKLPPKASKASSGPSDDFMRIFKETTERALSEERKRREAAESRAAVLEKDLEKARKQVEEAWTHAAEKSEEVGLLREYVESNEAVLALPAAPSKEQLESTWRRFSAARTALLCVSQGMDKLEKGEE